MAATRTTSRLAVWAWTPLPETQREQISHIWHSSRIWFGAVFIVFGFVLAFTGQWKGGIVVAALATISVIDASMQIRREPWREPFMSALIDAGVIFLAMSAAQTPDAAMGIPYAYVMLYSMLLLRTIPAAVVLIAAGTSYLLAARIDGVTVDVVFHTRALAIGAFVDLTFVIAIIVLVRIVIIIMNRERLRRLYRLRMQEAIAQASSALLSDAGEDPIEEALQALLEATDATAVFVEMNVDDPELGLCSSLLSEVLGETTSPDPEGLWDRVPWSESAGREALEVGKSHTVVVSELEGPERERYLRSGVKTELDLPIMVGGEWWGLVGFTDVYGERPWARREQYLLVTAAEMIGAYVERMQSREELDRRVDYHHAVAACGAALQASDGDDAIDEALQALVDATHVDYIGLDVNYHDPVFGPGYRIVHEARKSGGLAPEGSDLPVTISHADMPTATRSLSKGRPSLIMTRDLHGREREIYKKYGVRSELCLPVMVSGTWHGSIAFADHQTERTFTPLEVRILSTAAQMIGVFSERRRAKKAVEELVASQENRLRYESAIAECSRALLMSGDEAAVDMTLPHLMDATGSHSIFVHRNDIDSEQGVVADLTHELVREGFRDRVPSRVARHEGDEVSRLVYRDLRSLCEHLEVGQPAIVIPATMLPSDRRIYGPNACKSELNIPIMAGERWLGSIGFADCEKERSWAAEEISLLQTVAEMIGAFWERNDDHERLEELIRSKDEFVASVSHELRTPLSSVVGLSYELRDRRGEFSEIEADGLMSVIAEQSAEVADIIDDLLVTARADIGTLIVDPAPIDVATMLDGIMRTDLAAGFERVERIGPKITPLADPMRLRQILRNLIANAGRYGGPSLRIITSCEQDRALITVADDGPGVSPDLAQTIFRPYARAHHAGTQPASVGLGLSVARELARLMDGDLVYQRAGEWTEFVVVLPPYEDCPFTDGIRKDDDLAAADAS